MAPNFENGVDGDDEREEEEDEGDDSEEDGEDVKDGEEVEPRLKYLRRQGDMQTLLEKDAASCIAVADRAICLGTHSGKVYILDFLGNKDDTLLVIGWGSSVKIASIKSKQNNAVNGKSGHIQMSSINQVDIVASFQTNYFISELAPFGDSLVILAYIPCEEDKHNDIISVPSRQGNAQRPEVRVVTWINDELATDALPVLGYEHYKAQDYSLAHAPFSGSTMLCMRRRSGTCQTSVQVVS